MDNVGAYPPIIAANIQNIIRDGKDPDAELDKIEARNNFDINRLNTQWENRNRELNPKVTMDDLEKPLREPGLLPAGWAAKTLVGSTGRCETRKATPEESPQTRNRTNGRRAAEMVGGTLGLK